MGRKKGKGKILRRRRKKSPRRKRRGTRMRMKMNNPRRRRQEKRRRKRKTMKRRTRLHYQKDGKKQWIRNRGRRIISTVSWGRRCGRVPQRTVHQRRQKSM